MKLNAINGLRGLAVLAVIYHHLFWEITGPGYGAIKIGNITVLPYSFLSNGWLAVNLFFILSGFVLYLPYAQGTRSMRSTQDIKKFYRRRAERLLPLYYFSILICWIFVGLSGSPSKFIGDFLLLGTATFNFTTTMWFPNINWVLWSLGIEIWFCVFFPLLVLTANRWGILCLFAGVLVLSLIVRIFGNIYAVHFDVNNPFLNALKDSLAGRLDDFVGGMFLCEIYLRNKTKNIRQKILIPQLILGISLIYSVCCGWDYVRLGILTRKAVPFFNNVLYMGFFCLIGAVLQLKKGLIQSVFTLPPLQIVGMMSYSLYIWHGVAIHPIVQEHYVFSRILIYFFLLFSLSILSYRFIEFGRKNAKEIFTVPDNNL